MLRPQFAILLDGGFLLKKLYQRLSRHATADDIVQECARLQQAPQVHGYELLRIYYYDALPSSERVSFPISKRNYDLAKTEEQRQLMRFVFSTVTSSWLRTWL